MPEGKNIEYTGQANKRGSITEEGLDAMGLNGGEALGSFSLTADQNSDEYKRMYGRSSSQMQPIYFDFDSASIDQDQIPRLEHNAEYLRTNPSAQLLIEGNCDQRGTNEYNLALGERRARVAQNYLVELGIEATRIRTISYGEERPLFTGQTDDDFAQNRRDDFIIE
ncbi:MAG: peptidoglycan-associated lipoprotein [Deltaproteobacteria bacterium]|nr:MAG: peptidoglycan-associated lipoprotein [Deltaproteobacteria bacterium]